MLSRVVRQILQATVYDVAIETPLEAAPRISQKINNNIRFKREDLQPVFSFKLRGAYNRISQLPKDQLERGVICASAGNHAQGVALSGKKLGIHAIIVMPSTTPDIKVQAVKNLGGQVVLHGDSFDIANKYAKQRAEAEGLVFIHLMMMNWSLLAKAPLPMKSYVSGVMSNMFLLLSAVAV